jgi:hypothetical protein
LIEGYLYGEDFSTTETKIYTGVDLFAQCRMEQVKIFEFLNQVADTDLNKFAIDFDLINSYDNLYPNLVFVLKVDENFADALNEQFIIKFKMTDQKYTYLRIRADFQTTDSGLTPVLFSYKMKLG